MDLSSTLFDKPKFRPEVQIREGSDSIEIAYFQQGCNIYFDDFDKTELLKLIEAVTAGDSSIGELQQSCSQLSEQIPDILTEFDRLGLITESAQVSASGEMSGQDFYFIRLLPTIKQVQLRLGDSPLYQAMRNNAVTKQQLIGYALEYYHLVNMSPGLVSPSIAHVANKTIRKLLIKLFVDEYDHDKMTITALKTVGIDEATLLARQPLPSSYSAYISLGVYARQHILSFYSALILFETPSDQFNALFAEKCKMLDLPEGFYQPLLKHSALNTEGEHDSITLDLLREIPVISLQEQNTILIHITALVEMLYQQDSQIVEYYGSDACDLLRTYS